ncbi:MULTISPECIES: phenylacetic acid degradation protein PaaY [unclassified Pseudomonas]|uniref:phenylacetic acid degradation protein PaaY n=1 Tax=unclassified Pseudomonas TaxID=196821 RepID=UPI0016147573|nr:MULTISPECIES: phenylacetic acid degradation protein PaaY [unclassified Pseudomonas]MBB6290495.1 phenylacetic acid degradation protein [Pseudomonas sp. SJZ073]MBB6315778.1 phenylacetic acid degradation protein [Pseudomonas sp. JAI120]
MPCYRFNGLTPVVHPSAYVHPTAVLIGDVIIGAGCYVGPLASLRGDFGRIVMKAGSNVQDTCVIHGFPASETVVEENGHIGHGAVLHGCLIGADSLIGMNAVVMDNAVIAPRCIVAASAFVKSGFKCEAQSMVMGAPASVKRTVTDQELEWKKKGTEQYQMLAQKCLESMVECLPLCAEEPERERLSDSGFRPKGERQQ